MDTQIAEEKACLQEKNAAAAIEKERKSVAAEKRRKATIKRKGENEMKKAAKKQKWAADKVQLEGFKTKSLENPILSTSNNAGPSSWQDM
jgi:hypothetical protein